MVEACKVVGLPELEYGTDGTFVWITFKRPNSVAGLERTIPDVPKLSATEVCGKKINNETIYFYKYYSAFVRLYIQCLSSDKLRVGRRVSFDHPIGTI